MGSSGPRGVLVTLCGPRQGDESPHRCCLAAGQTPPPRTCARELRGLGNRTAPSATAACAKIPARTGTARRTSTKALPRWGVSPITKAVALGAFDAMAAAAAALGCCVLAASPRSRGRGLPQVERGPGHEGPRRWGWMRPSATCCSYKVLSSGQRPARTHD